LSFIYQPTTGNGMIDYYETKSQPITKLMVWQAYKKVRQNKGSSGVDGMTWAKLDSDLPGQLYKLWNRMSSVTNHEKCTSSLHQKCTTVYC